MTESNERKPMTFTCQQLAPWWWCAPGKCPMWCGLGRCQPVFAARAAAPQARPSEPPCGCSFKPKAGEPGMYVGVICAKHCDEAAAAIFPQAQPAIAPNCPYDHGPMGAYFSGWRCAACGSSCGSPEPAPAERTVLPGAYRVRVMDDGQQLWGPAPPEPAPISDERIVEIWQGMPGGYEGFLKEWGYLQFARALLAEKGAPN